MKRFIILRIDDLYRMLADYCGEVMELPADAKPIKFRINPQAQGKLELMIESDSWEKNQPGEQVKFDLRRVYSV